MFEKLRNGKKSLVIAHKGGNFAPKNSLANFKAAMEHSVEGIEFDVWLTKDEVPVIMHGGSDGTLKDYDLPDEHVFYWTLQQLESTIDLGED